MKPFLSLTVTLTLLYVGNVACMTNYEFYTAMKPYLSDVEIVPEYADTSSVDDVIQLPGGPDDELDMAYVVRALGFLPNEDADDSNLSLEDRLGLSGNCKCSTDMCKCCLKHTFKVKLWFHTIRFTVKPCLAVSYSPRTHAISISLSLNGHHITTYKLKSSHPPKVCFTVPVVKMAKLCLSLYNINLGQKSMCAKASISLDLKVHTFKFSHTLGCFKIPVPGDHGISDDDMLWLDDVNDYVRIPSLVEKFNAVKRMMAERDESSVDSSEIESEDEN